MSNYYPIFLNLKQKPCLVVGGGQVASVKIPPLLEAGARVTLVAQTIHPGVIALTPNSQLTLKHRAWRISDLDHRFLVIAATNDTSLNHKIHAICEARGILVNVVDDTLACNFILPSIARQGPLQVAVSSSGTSPTLARRLRQQIQAEILRPELGQVATFVGAWRSRINPHLPTFTLKKAYWRRVMQSRVGALVVKGRISGAVALLKSILVEIRHKADLPPLRSMQMPSGEVLGGCGDSHELENPKLAQRQPFPTGRLA